MRFSNAAPAPSLRRIAALLVLFLAALAVSLWGGSSANAADGPTVTGVAITSSAGPDKTYAFGHHVRVTLTFSEAVNVSGTPHVSIDMDPADWGTKQANYLRGSGSTELTFSHRVVEPNISTQGVAVFANSLALNGGSITSASSGAAVTLSHAGLAHDANHKVDWRAIAPTVTGVAITSDPGDDDTYAKDDVIEVTITFSEAVIVNGTPRLHIKMDPRYGQKRAWYSGGSGSTTLTFAHTVIEPNFSTRGVAVLADSLRLNHGTIRSVSSQTDVNRSHAGLAHDANHKVDWRLSGGAACEQVAPSSVSALTIGRGAVVSWTLPADLSDACEVTGFVVSATNEADRLSAEARVPDPAARSHTLRGLDPGDWLFSVRVQYAEGESDEYVMMEANSVPDACITLAVEPYAYNAISGKIASVNGTGCAARQMFNFEFKRTEDDYWYHYGRFPWSLVSEQTDANTPDFILYDLIEPFVSYDFRIRAYDASDSEYTTTAQSVTLSAHDPSETADANSPTGVRTFANNHGNVVALWNAYTAPTGRTLLNMVVEWKPCTNADVSTECVGFPSSRNPDATDTFHRITNLTHDQYYTVRVAARTHLSSQPASTATNAWSVWTPAIRTWFEPTQLWFEAGPAAVSGRLFIELDGNKNIGTSPVCTYNDDGTTGTINCPHGDLVTPEAEGVLSVVGAYSVDGVETRSSTQAGNTGGPGAPQVAASGGNGKLVFAWHGAVTNGIVGSVDAWFVEHRKQNADKSWPAWPTTRVQKAATDSSHTFTGLTNGTWQVRVQGRADGDDGDPMTNDTPILGFQSGILTVTLAADKTDTVIPAQVSVTPGDSQSLIVEWEVPDGASVPHAYQVRHRESGTTAWTESAELFPPATHRMCSHEECSNPRSLEIESLTGGTRYEVQVRARNANGWGEWSHTRAARPND